MIQEDITNFDSIENDIENDFENVVNDDSLKLDPNELLANLDYVGRRMHNLYELNDLYLQQLNECSSELLSHEEHLLLIEESKNYYIKAIDLIYENSIGELEKIVNLALQYIFYDTQYTMKIELEDKRGKSLSFYILDSEGNAINIDDVGCGVRTVASFVLHIYYLISKGSIPFLFLDEKLAGVSQEYVSRFFSFIKSLCTNKDLILVGISHDPRFMSYADKIYNVGNGVVRLVTKSDDDDKDMLDSLP